MKMESNIICSKCRRVLPDTANFCPYCGTVRQKTQACSNTTEYRGSQFLDAIENTDREETTYPETGSQIKQETVDFSHVPLEETEEYILDANTLIIRAYSKKVYVDVPSVLSDNGNKAIDILVFEEGIETIVGVHNTMDEGPTSVRTIVLPESLISIGNSCFIGCTLLERIKLPGHLKEIGNKAFKECTSLKEIIFPKSLVSIGEECFSKCATLERVDLPENLVSLGKYAFSSCCALKSVTLPPRLTAIGDAVFNQCSSLSWIDIPEGIISIGEFAFSETGIETMVLPSSLQKIEDYAFGVAPNIHVRIPNNAPVYTEGVFQKMAEKPAYTVFDPSGANYISYVECPRCHSHNISERKVHIFFSIIKALLFFVFPPAVLLGFIGKNRIEYRCNSCGQKWYKKPGRFSMKTIGEWFMYL